MEDNKNLLEFWNKTFEGLKVEEVEDWITDESFIKLIGDYITDGVEIIDFGCGSGWASFYLAKRFPNSHIIGIDPSSNAVKYANEVARLSKLDNANFIENNEVFFDFNYEPNRVLVSFNVLDVVPIYVLDHILKDLQRGFSKDGYLLIGVNPTYPVELLKQIGYEVKDNVLYKDGIFRGTLLNDEEWKNKLSEYFEFVEERNVSLTEQEKKYPRRIFVVKNSK